MCTIILANQLWPELPLLVAANRDEKLARPSAPPSRWLDGALAPRDVQAGGTWIGVSDTGLVAAVTNRFGPPPDPTRRSRGELVPKALAASSAEEAARWACALPVTAYNPFHLVVADRSSAWLVRERDGQLDATALGVGVHVISERSSQPNSSVRDAGLQEAVSRWTTSSPPSDHALEGLLGGHHEPSYEGVCVHLPEMGYGTRSSSIVRLWTEDRAGWRYADGAPCETAYHDLDV